MENFNEHGKSNRLNFLKLKIIWAFFSILCLFFTKQLSAQFPTDFQKIDLVTGLSNSTNFSFAPDGRIFILDRYGEVLIYKQNTQSVVSAGVLSVFHELEDGLIGIAFDPNFSTNDFVYLHYSPLSASVNRISRFKMNGDILDMSSETTIIEFATMRSAGINHSGGDMAFDSKGNLLIAVGDNSIHSNYAAMNETNQAYSAEKSSSNANDLRGKILRITPQVNGSYTIPSGNLFPNGTGGLPEIYVMGARNPYRIFIDKEHNDWLFWGEVGPDASAESSIGPEGLDEINLTKSAGNYGWPYFSGADNDPYLNQYSTPNFYYDPLVPVNLSQWNTGVTNLPPAQPALLEFFHKSHFAGPRYSFDVAIADQQKLPIEYDDVFFYYDFNTSRIWGITLDTNGNVLTNDQIAPAVFPNSQDGFIDMKIGPDGHMYILAYGAGCCPNNVGTGRLMRIDYTGVITNSPPIVTLETDVISGSLPLTVNFSSSGTYDPNGDTSLAYAWDFTTDGIINSTQENPAFTYTTAGTYNAQLKVDDGNGGIGVKNITIYAGNTLTTFSFNSPPDGGFVDWNDDINLDIEVTDNEDGSISDGGINCSEVNLVPSLGHLNHFHDDLTLDACQETITLDPSGHDVNGDMDIYYVLGANYTDQGGLTSFDQIILHPKRIEAEFYDTQNGVTVIDNTDSQGGGNEVLRVTHNSHISFSERNLLKMTSLKYRVASISTGGIIELRVGSPTGNIVSSTTIPTTGSLETWVDIEDTFTAPIGKNDLFFVFKNTSAQQNIFDINFIELIGTGVSVDNTPPEVDSFLTQNSTEALINFNEHITQATSENLANYSINNGISIISAALQPNGSSVLIGYDQLGTGTTYNLTIQNIANEEGLLMIPQVFSLSLFDPIAINAGGATVSASPDNFEADQYATGGTSYTSAIPIDNTTDDAIYQTERFGNFTYDIPVPEAGEYDIRLHFAELYWGLPGNGSTGGVGTRVFNVTIEGNAVLTDFDISAEVSPATALRKELDNISITDGFATITFTSVVENPKVSAIEILPPNTFNVNQNTSITINSPSQGSSVNQPFDLAFAIENWTIAQGDTHMHYYIDDVMVGPHYSYEPITIEGLSPGNHKVKLELFNANHTGTGIIDEVTVNVTGALTCNETPFPSDWGLKQLEASSLPYRSVYTFPEHDLDGDGLKDIVTGGWWYKNPGSVAGNWVRSDIGGTFKNVALVHDFDNDGDMDLLGTTGVYTGADLVWAQNNGSGSFTVFTNIPSGNTNYSEPFLAGIAGGIFQVGGVYQMAINWNGAESTGSPMQMLTPTVDPTIGTWSLVNIPNAVSTGEDLQAGDIDQDNDLDLFQGPNWIRNNGISGWETISTGISYVTTPDRVQLADFDRDGDLDAVVGQLGLGGGTNPARFEFAWFEAPADPTQPWIRRVLDSDIHGSLSVSAKDIDFDGDTDIVVGEWRGENRLIVFENKLCVEGSFEKRIIDEGDPAREHHDGARVTDIDNDGDLDVISNGWADNYPRIYENTSAIFNNQSPTVSLGISNETITLPVNNVTLTGSGNDPDGGTVDLLWTQQGGPSTASLSGAMTSSLAASNLIAGTYVFRLMVTDDENETVFEEVSVNVNPEVTNNFALRINTGGPATIHSGQEFIADQYRTGGSLYSVNFPINSTIDDEIYQTEVYSSRIGPFSYEIPVGAAGLYDIHLHFAELYFGVKSGGIGSRVFNVSIEGSSVLSNFDILNEVAPATALLKVFNGIQVNDGFASIVFTGVTQRAKISAIEVLGSGSATSAPTVNLGSSSETITLPVNNVTLTGSGNDPDGGTVDLLWTQQSGPSTASLSGAMTSSLAASNLIAGTYVFRLMVTDDENETVFDEVSVNVNPEVTNNFALRINTGGPATIHSGQEFIADQYRTGGSLYSVNFPINSTIDDEIYQTEVYSSRIGPFSYEIPVGAAGLYDIHLHFAELYFGVKSGGIGSRVFNVSIEGSSLLSNFDILNEVAPATALLKVFNGIQVNDGFASIVFTGVTQRAKISAIEVLGSGSATSAPTVNLGSSSETITLPVNNITLTGSGNDPDGGTVDLLWTQQSGPSTAWLLGTATSSLAASNLQEGTYIFRLTVTDDENETAFDQVNVIVNPEVIDNQSPTVSLGSSNVTITLPLNSVTLTGSGNDPDGGSVDLLWTQQSGPITASLSGATTSSLAANNLVAGTYVFRLTVTDDENETVFDEVSVNLNPEVTNNFALRINTGGTATTYSGETFITDQYSDTGNTLDRPQTGLPEPYQTFRFSRSQIMSYDIPVPDGEYTVRLHFAELWFGATGGGSGGVGSRVFDVSIEGQLVEDNLDVFATVGADAMLVRNHTVTVSGGVLNIDFSSLSSVGGTRHPIINAIEIIGASESAGNGKQGDFAEKIADNQIEAGDLFNNKSSVVIPVLYPNPASDFTMIRMTTEIDISEVSLFDLTGKLVRRYKEAQLNGSQEGIELKLIGIENGIYMVTVVPKNTDMFRLKLVIKN